MTELGYHILTLQAVVWFLARWMSTYLMIPEETGEKHFQNPLLSFYGENNQGKVVLDIIIRISSSIFVSYPGEKDLQVLSLACLGFLGWFRIVL